MKNFNYLILLFFSLFIFFSCDDDSGSNNFDLCGNNFKDFNEDCDGSDFGGETCVTLGYYEGTLKCTNVCTFDESGCANRCGDGVIQSDFGEQCDGEELAATTCLSEGFNGGELKCDSECHFDYSECYEAGKCGDGTVQSDYEECDGYNTNGKTCLTLGYYGGFLECDSACRFKLDVCQEAGWCGDNILQEEHEECDNPLYSEECGDEYYGGHITCGEDCHFDYSECYEAGKCGDGTVQSDYEECENIALSESCYDYGYISPSLPSCVSCLVEGCSMFYQWGSSQIDYAKAAGFDSAGNFYVTGRLFGSSPTYSDAYITKFNSDGSLIQTITWSMYTNAEEFSDIYITSGDEIYVAGSTQRDATTLNMSAVLVKYTSDGTKLWEKVIGTDNFWSASGVSVDSSGNVYLYGSTNLTDVSSVGGVDLFLNKYTSDGTLLWSKRFGTAASDTSEKILIDASDNIYITGSVNSSLPGQTSNGRFDMGLIKLNVSGDIIWARQFGTSENDLGLNIAVDSSGNIYIAGRTEGDFASSSAGGSDAFLMKVSSDGNMLWNRQWGKAGFDAAMSVKEGNDGNIYVAGHVNDSNTGYDIYLKSFDSDGTELQYEEWGSNPFNSSKDDFAYDLIISTNGIMYIIGRTTGVFPFNSGFGNFDSFIMKHYE